MKTFYLPDLGEGLSTAEIIKWHVRPGEKVSKDQTMVTVETTKSLVDIPSPVNGVIDKIHVKKSEEINVDQPMISFITNEIIQKTKTETPVSRKTSKQTHIINESKISKAQPAARHLAKHLNIDLNQINTKKIISIEDVLNINQSQTDKVLPKRRRQMCELATISHNSVTSSTVTEIVDIHSWLDKNDFFAYVLKIISETLLKHPPLNSHYIPNKKFIQYTDKVDLGIAMQTKDGLFVPKIQNTQNLSIDNIRNELEFLKTKAQNQELELHNTYQPTFIVSNFGSLGAGQFGTPMILPPAVCTLAIGSIFKNPVNIKESIKLHNHLPISLSFNHRVVYGAEAIYFLKDLKENLQ